ncbi:SPOR domain-containing protein [Proteiniborus sp.]|uniref:SPOR domain-containing protein n=1 Tax=Proteiniborus sp. TaxID=2079015 RepID=UPI0033285F19
MRRNAGRRVNRNNKDRLYTIFAFFVVAPIISIVLAFGLVQNVILPRLAEEQKTINTIEEGLGEEEKSDNEFNIDTNITDNENVTEVVPTEETQGTAGVIEETTFYSVQVGNFSSITNAEALVKELKENNINDGYIVNNEESYKVFAGEFQIKDEAYNYLDKIRKLYEDAFVNTLSSKEKIIRPD